MKVFDKIIRKINENKFKYCFDKLKFDSSYIEIKGWIFNLKEGYEAVNICFKTDLEIIELPVLMYERIDVFNTFGEKQNAKMSGFSFAGKFDTDLSVEIYLKANYKGKFDKVMIANIPAKAIIKEENKKIVINELVGGYCNYKEFKNKFVGEYENVALDSEVDVIIPIYNGYDYLENLLKTVEKTNVKYRLFLINDCSTDERVLPVLTKYAEERDNVILINNIENLGFVQSVNKALTLTKNDVALVNSDVIMPQGWLERLINPIKKDRRIATTTPFTNSGTICSFPDFCADNSIFMDLDVDTIDSVFKKFKTTLNEMPTGVGFCMGMNREAINRVGLLDAETFYKGYGEENDWCQRAINLGYVNVHVENLFVYHKHGASFPSEEKKRYIERNLKLLNQMHPSYDKDVQQYCASDPAKYYREYAKFSIMAEKVKNNILIFDHNWGGGANSYCKIRIKNELEKGYGVLKFVRDSNGKNYIEYYYDKYMTGFNVKDFAEFEEMLGNISIKEIIINEIISFENIYSILEYLINFKEKTGVRLTMLGHDFYSICPSIYLMNNENKHCYKADISECEKCICSNKNIFNDNYENIKKWRSAWNEFLMCCDEITVFSENSKEYFMHHYPKLNNIKVLPHKVDYIQKIEPYKLEKKKTVIGFIGNFMKTKGADVVIEMSEIIEEKKLPVKIVVIGQNMSGESCSNIKITGKYTLENLPKIIAENKIDIIFIASVWPETFSYTTEEAIKMGMKVASFDIGAPAERISKYDKGLIISKIDAETAINEIMKFVKK